MPTLMSDTQMVLPDREGDVPGPGGGGGHRHRPLRRRRRRGRGRGRLRAAAGGGGSLQGPGARRAGAAHRQAGQEGQPHLPLGGRATAPATDKAFKDAAVVVKQRIYIPRIHVASIETCGCVASFDKAAGQAHGLDDHPGAARHPHRLRAGGRPRRPLGGEDPHHLAGHRRRLRRQGPGLSRLRHRGGGLGGDRQAGQVDRGPDGEPPGRLLRPRLPHRRRAGGRRRTAR